MARKANLTFEEIEKAEIAADKRRGDRVNGFSLMRDRDFGTHTLSNGVVMNWHVPKPTEGDYIYRYIPEDSFELVIDGKKTLFNTEEFQRWLRWA